MKYKKGYKYQLVEDYTFLEDTNGYDYGIYLEIATDFISINVGGLTIKAGYAWDGPSGPTIDTKNFIRGSMIHDAVYQLIRDGLLDSSYRKQADLILRDVCIEDGMSQFRAWYVYRSVRMFGGRSIKPSASRKVLEAP